VLHTLFNLKAETDIPLSESNKIIQVLYYSDDFVTGLAKFVGIFEKISTRSLNKSI